MRGAARPDHPAGLAERLGQVHDVRGPAAVHRTHVRARSPSAAPICPHWTRSNGGGRSPGCRSARRSRAGTVDRANSLARHRTPTGADIDGRGGGSRGEPPAAPAGRPNCPPVNGSASRWPERCCGCATARGCCCWTSRRRTSTRPPPAARHGGRARARPRTAPPSCMATHVDRHRRGPARTGDTGAAAGPAGTRPRSGLRHLVDAGPLVRRGTRRARARRAHRADRDGRVADRAGRRPSVDRGADRRGRRGPRVRAGQGRAALRRTPGHARRRAAPGHARCGCGCGAAWSPPGPTRATADLRRLRRRRRHGARPGAQGADTTAHGRERGGGSRRDCRPRCCRPPALALAVGLLVAGGDRARRWACVAERRATRRWPRDAARWPARC